MDEICFIIQICAKGIKGSYYTFSKQIVITKNGQKDGSDVGGKIENIPLLKPSYSLRNWAIYIWGKIKIIHHFIQLLIIGHS